MVRGPEHPDRIPAGLESSDKFSIGELIKRKIEREKPISPLEYIEELAREKKQPPKNACDFIYQALTNPKPVQLENGYYDYPALSKRIDEFAVHGLNGPLEQIVDFVQRGKETSGDKKGLLLVGPSGAGKTIVVNAVKKISEEFSRKSSPAMRKVKDCPIQEDPKNLFKEYYDLAKPDEKQELVEYYGFEPDQDPCTKCKQTLKDNGYDLENIQIDPLDLSFGSGISKLHKLPKGFSEADLVKVYESILPSNRGILELPEFSQYPLEEFEAIEFNDFVRGNKGRRLQFEDEEKKFRAYVIDTLIIAHTTVDEYKKLTSNDSYKTLLTRFDVVKIPYNLSPKTESDIYKKSLRVSGFPYYGSEQDTSSPDSLHISDRTFQVFGEQVVLTRIKTTDLVLDDGSNRKLDYQNRLKLYVGEDVEGFRQSEVAKIQKNELRKDEHWSGDGFFGKSPAAGEDMIRSIVSEARADLCLNPFAALVKLTEKSEIADKNLEIIRERNEEWLARSIRMASVPNYEEEREKQTVRYLLNAEMYQQKTQTLNPLTEKFEGADTGFLCEIENKAFPDRELTDQERENRRKSVVLSYSSKVRHGKGTRYEDISDWVQKGIDREIFGTPQELAKMIETGLSPVTDGKMTQEDRENQMKFFEIKRNLVEKYGFCQSCAPELMKKSVTRDKDNKTLFDKHK